MVQEFVTRLKTYTLPANNITLSAGDVTKICKGNPRRVALGIFSTFPTVRIYPLSQGTILSEVIPSSAFANGYWFYASAVGPLCMIEWYAYCTAVSNITVLEVVEE